MNSAKGLTPIVKGSPNLTKPVTPFLGQYQISRAALPILGNTLSNTTQPLEQKRVTIA